MPTIWNVKKEPPPRDENDHYPTEQALIDAALGYLANNELSNLAVFWILDAAAGNDGRWGLSAARHFREGAGLAGVNIRLTGVELRDVPKPDGYHTWYNMDFLEFDYPNPYNLIVSNPPYNQGNKKPPLGEKFIFHAWRLLAPMGAMIFLLPLDYQVGQGRYHNLFTVLPPLLVMPVANRVAFKKGTNGGTNNHAVFVWVKNRTGWPVGQPNRWPTMQLFYNREKD